MDNFGDRSKEQFNKSHRDKVQKKFKELYKEKCFYLQSEKELEKFINENDAILKRMGLSDDQTCLQYKQSAKGKLKSLQEGANKKGNSQTSRNRRNKN